jgi:hypothetical protein
MYPFLTYLLAIAHLFILAVTYGGTKPERHCRSSRESQIEEEETLGILQDALFSPGYPWVPLGAIEPEHEPADYDVTQTKRARESDT